MTDDTALPIFRQRPAVSPAEVAREALAGGGPPPRSLYIHIPFCAHKCHYCDFYSFVDSRDRQGEFTDRLCRELTAAAPLARGEPVETIFVGGGTPTLLRTDLWAELLTTLERVFNLDRIRSGDGEFTVECNPETASAELFDRLVEGGVSRLSVGAQSFVPRHLETLERHHDPANVARALELARAAGIARRSIDLIYAIPGQTIAELRGDLHTALALPIDHLSAYNLTYEPNTAMTARLNRGDFTPADEDTELEMFWLVRETCRRAGLEPYEVSNFARPGSACRHNLAYWRQEQWLAAGPSASGHVAGHRFKVVPRLADYLARDDGGFAPIVDHEPPDPARLLAERLMTGIRLEAGLDRNAVLAEARAVGCEAPLAEQIDAVTVEGWVTIEADRLRLTNAGLPLADHVASCLMSAIG